MRQAVSVAALAAVLVVIGAGEVHGQAKKQIKVRVDFRQTGLQAGEAVGGSGRVVVGEKGSARPSGRLTAESRDTRVQQSTGIFTIVQDGGEAVLTVATQVPHPRVLFYRDYATQAGYASGVVFRDVGTSLKVSASILPDDQVRVRLTPVISYLTAGGSGAIEFAEASTELVVRSGRPVVLGGVTAQTHTLTREILGVRQQQSGRESTVTLTATVQ